MIKKGFIAFILVMMASTVSAQSLTIDDPLGDNNTVNALDDLNFNVSGDVTGLEDPWIELNITDNESNYVTGNTTASNNRWSEITNIKELNDGNITIDATGKSNTAVTSDSRVGGTDGPEPGDPFEWAITVEDSDKTINQVQIRGESFDGDTRDVDVVIEESGGSTVLDETVTVDGMSKEGWHYIDVPETELEASKSYDVTIPTDIRLNFGTSYGNYGSTDNGITYNDGNGGSPFTMGFSIVESNPTDTHTVTKDTDFNYNLSKDLSFEWNFEGRKTVFYDDVITDAYTLEFQQSAESDYLNLSRIRPNEIFGYINESDDINNYYNTKNESLNTSNMNLGETRTKSFDVRFSDIPVEFWDQMTSNSSNDLFTVNIIARSFDGNNEFESSYQIEEQRAFDLPEEGLVAVIQRAVSSFIDDILNVLNPVFDILDSLFNWFIDVIGFIINFVIDLFMVGASTLINIVSDFVGLIITTGSNAVQYIVFYHVDLDYEYDNNTYDNFSDADITFIDAVKGNLSVKSNETQDEFFTGGVASNNPAEISFINHYKRIDLYSYDFRSVETQKNYTEDIPSRSD